MKKILFLLAFTFSIACHKKSSDPAPNDSTPVTTGYDLTLESHSGTSNYVIKSNQPFSTQMLLVNDPPIINSAIGNDTSQIHILGISPGYRYYVHVTTQPNAQFLIQADGSNQELKVSNVMLVQQNGVVAGTYSIDSIFTAPINYQFVVQ